MNTDISNPRDSRRAAELRDNRGGWFASHALIFDNRTGGVKRDCAIFGKDVSEAHVRNSRMDPNPYMSWLVENLKAEGKTQSGLARHLGIHPSAVNKMVHGFRSLKSHEIARAAEYFEIASPQVPELTTTGRSISVVVTGLVEAGSFREVDELIDDSERAEVVVPVDDKFPNARVMAFDVGGDSMNRLEPRPILPGDRVVGVAYEDVAHMMPLRDGMVVVVERSSGGGHMREWSVKQLEIYEDRLEFHPRSSNRKHKPIIVRRDLEADEGMSVEIIVLVRRVVNDIPLS